MNIADITNRTPTRNTPVANPSTQLGKDDFLRLLTVQLRYQDPLNPLENTEFIAQMAQFSSLEQLQNMNQSLEKNLDAETQLQTAFRNNLATSLVGRSVEIPTWEVEFDGRDKTSLTYRLGEGARRAELQILDARGNLVRHFDLDSSSRYGTLTWDGKSDDGRKVPVGAYRAVVHAEDAAGDAVDGELLKKVRVQAVRYGREVKIWADGRELSLSDLGGVLDERE